MVFYNFHHIFLEYVLNDFVNNIIEDNITYAAQDEANVSFAPTLKKEDGFLDFKTQKYSDIKNRIKLEVKESQFPIRL